jgi:hypothetical protein
MNGSLTVANLLVSNYTCLSEYDTFEISFLFIFLIIIASTQGNISTLSFTTSPSLFTATGNHFQRPLSLGIQPVDCSSEENGSNMIKLGSITATFYNGPICSLSVSDSVTLNFGSSDIVCFFSLSLLFYWFIDILCLGSVQHSTRRKHISAKYSF